jgi:hypothetical protein
MATFLIELSELSEVSYTALDDDNFDSWVTTAIRSDCSSAASELDGSCYDSFDDYPRRVELEAGTYFLLMHRSSFSAPDAVNLEISIRSLITQCNDGVDNDDDGLLDNEDPGCENAEDDDETDPELLPECADTLDNNDNALTDYPEDPFCLFAGQTVEGPYCSAESGEISVVTESTTLSLDTSAMGSDYGASCGLGAASPEGVVGLVINELTEVRIETISPDVDTVLHVREGAGNCDDSGAEIACNDDGGDANDSLVTFTAEPGAYYVFVDTFGTTGTGGDVDVVFTLTSLVTECSDGLDNDQDDLIDLADPGCATPSGDSEADPATLPECADGVDNDADGLVDYPDDTSCAGAGQAVEGAFCSAESAELITVTESGVVSVDTTEAGGDYSGSCRTTSSPESVVVIELDADSSVTVETIAPDVDTVLHVRERLCDDEGAEIACNDDGGDMNDSLLTFSAAAGVTYYVFVDGFGASNSGAIDLSVTITPEP